MKDARYDGLDRTMPQTCLDCGGLTLHYGVPSNDPLSEDTWHCRNPKCGASQGAGRDSEGQSLLSLGI